MELWNKAMGTDKVLYELVLDLLREFIDGGQRDDARRVQKI